MMQRLILLAAAAALLPGCASVHMREDTASPPPYAPKAEYATQVAVGDCIFTRQEEGALAGIASALLGNAVSAGVNRIGTALTEAAKEKTLSTKASRNLEVSASTFGPCVQVIRGWFHQDPFPLGTGDDPLADNANFLAAQSALQPDFISRQRLHTLWLRNQLWLAAPPEFLFEGRIMAAKNNVLTIAPQYVRMDEPLFTRSLRRDPARHVAVFLSFSAPGAAVDAETNPGATFVIGRLVPGEARTYPDPRSIVKFTPDDRVLNRWPHESDWFTLAIGKDKEPWIATAAVTEKQSANEFLAFVAEVFDSSKATITTELQNVIVPDKRAAVKENAASAQETAASSLDEKQVGALTKLEACAQADAPNAQNASDVRSALRQLNQAARAAHRDEPAAGSCIDRVSITAAPAANKAACGSIHAALAKGDRCS